jgi:hypothetical protein
MALDAERCYAEYHYAECHVYMQTATNKPLKLSVIMLSVVVQNVMAPYKFLYSSFQKLSF